MRQLVTDPPDVVVATTGVGFRGWIEAAEHLALRNRAVGVMRVPVTAGPFVEVGVDPLVPDRLDVVAP